MGGRSIEKPGCGVRVDLRTLELRGRVNTMLQVEGMLPVAKRVQFVEEVGYALVAE